MKKSTLSTLTAVTLAFLSSSIVAESRYVTDSLKLNLRTGASSQHKIIRQLRSGDKVELLATDSSGEFAFVRTSKGKEGWALTGYLQKSPTAKVSLKSAVQKAQSAQKKLKSVTVTNQQLIEENKLLSRENQDFIKKNDQLSKDYADLQDLSGNAVNITRKNRELLEQTSLQKNAIEMHSAEVSRLEDQISSDQFYMGAGAILIGLMLGLILPHVRPSQKSSEWA
ncbi:MAG: TIGR04211 family SH3 domain-containing protein [Pseudomonadales bacterium]|nr:TIGR04211 family SH3 domain-containing protein [Pseudomonadales bacterium]